MAIEIVDFPIKNGDFHSFQFSSKIFIFFHWKLKEITHSDSGECFRGVTAVLSMRGHIRLIPVKHRKTEVLNNWVGIWMENFP
jgi:hypothetical protein